MQRVGEKLGFQKEGILKDAQFKNGCFNDIILYGKVR
jgi:RimJ/RimL family protein N-acetyltransferase